LCPPLLLIFFAPGDTGDRKDTASKNFFLSTTSSTIEFPRLEKLRRLASGDVISACPACREIGKDREGDNFRVFSSGAFHCIAFQNDKEHNSRIFALVGIKGELANDPNRDHEWRQRQAKERLERQRQETLAKKARDSRDTLASRHAWGRANIFL
jgi:hypothetical protein